MTQLPALIERAAPHDLDRDTAPVVRIRETRSSYFNPRAAEVITGRYVRALAADFVELHGKYARSLQYNLHCHPT